MTFEQTDFSGLYKILLDNFTDNRGSLTKVFVEEAFREQGLPTNFPECFFSTSAKNVIRGMHLQLHHTACQKMVYVTNGAILDVILDLREEEPTYKQFRTFELSAENHTTLLIPEGCAHGFLSLKDATCVMYMQTHMRNAAHEGGIHHASFGMDWPVHSPIVSERDLKLKTLQEYLK